MPTKASFTAINTSGTVAFGPVSNTTSLQSPVSFALDGAGDIWYANSTSNAYFSIGEISPTGSFLTPTSGFPTSGLIPTGINNPVAVAIDAYGNLWIVNYPIGNNAILGFLQKVPAVAIPKSQQYY